MYVTIRDLFEQTVHKYPDKEALCYPDKQIRWTYAEWNREVNRLANALTGAGVRKGDRVSTFLFNTEELATCLFACAKLGAVFNPINFRLKPEELAFIVGDAEPTVLLFEQALSTTVEAIHSRFPDLQFWCVDAEVPAFAVDYHARVDAGPDTRPDTVVEETDLYGIMYTSGTTGHPKGVMHRHRDMVDQSMTILAELRLTAHDKGLSCAPLFHCAELHCNLIPRIHVGAGSVILHQFEPQRVLELVGQERVTTMFCAPTMWNMLLQEDLSRYDLGSLKRGLYGAAPMAPALVRACQEKLNVALFQAYGQTEMGPAVTFLRDYEQMDKNGSAGNATLNHEIRVIATAEDRRVEPEETLPPGEVGEIIVRGPGMMIGYFNRDDATAKAIYKGWYYSGDLGYLDADNYLYVADRKDDMVISGGENIYPREVEDTLYEHPDVRDVAVLGRPDAHWGETVVAFVVVSNPDTGAEALDAFCRASPRLADYKRPREYHFIDELPRNASGKTQKFILRERLARARADQPD